MANQAGHANGLSRLQEPSLVNEILCLPYLLSFRDYCEYAISDLQILIMFLRSSLRFLFVDSAGECSNALVSLQRWYIDQGNLAVDIKT